MDSDITLELIRAYATPDQVRRVKTGRMAAFCVCQHYSGRTHPAVLVDRLTPHLLEASEATTAGKSFTSPLFAEELRMHTEHLRAFDKRLDELLQRHPDAPIFTSFPGIGPVVAATPISEMGDDRTRFPSQMRCLRRPGSPRSPKPPVAPRQVRFRYAANGGCGTPSTGGLSWPVVKTPGPRCGKTPGRSLCRSWITTWRSARSSARPMRLSPERPLPPRRAGLFPTSRPR
jgi:hypothetical protein